MVADGGERQGRKNGKMRRRRRKRYSRRKIEA
jgi:hypothetical protein